MSVRERSSEKNSARGGEATSSRSSANGASASAKKKARSKKRAAKKATAKKASSKRTTAEKAAPKKTAEKKTAKKKTAKKKTAKKKTAKKKTAETRAAKKKAVDNPEPGAGRLLPPVEVRRSREDKAWAEARLAEIDEVMSAWADILAERMVADQTFSEIVEQLEVDRPRDLRGLFLWEALHAAESHVALITEVIATHLEDRRADPVAILADLRDRRRQVAAVYAVNAFLAVLNQMKPTKPKWVSMDEIDPRFAVLALAHQTLKYAAEAVQAAIPADLTDLIISATQDDAVWVWRRMPEPGTDTLAACAAAAAFFRQLDADVLVTTDEVAADYAAHGRS